MNFEQLNYLWSRLFNYRTYMFILVGEEDRLQFKIIWEAGLIITSEFIEIHVQLWIYFKDSNNHMRVIKATGF